MVSQVALQRWRLHQFSGTWSLISSNRLFHIQAFYCKIISSYEDKGTNKDVQRRASADRHILSSSEDQLLTNQLILMINSIDQQTTWFHAVQLKHYVTFKLSAMSATSDDLLSAMSATSAGPLM